MDENPPGPVHDHAVVPVELANNVAVPPAHTGPLLVAPVEDGPALTVTAVVYTVAELQPLPGLLSVSE